MPNARCIPLRAFPVPSSSERLGRVLPSSHGYRYSGTVGSALILNLILRSLRWTFWDRPVNTCTQKRKGHPRTWTLHSISELSWFVRSEVYRASCKVPNGHHPHPHLTLHHGGLNLGCDVLQSLHRSCIWSNQEGTCLNQRSTHLGVSENIRFLPEEVGLWGTPEMLVGRQ
jgi:hypothetical protein